MRQRCSSTTTTLAALNRTACTASSKAMSRTSRLRAVSHKRKRRGENAMSSPLPIMNIRLERKKSAQRLKPPTNTW